jgi:hypothetical protein
VDNDSPLVDAFDLLRRTRYFMDDFTAFGILLILLEVLNIELVVE